MPVTQVNKTLLLLDWTFDPDTCIVTGEFTGSWYMEGPPEIIHSGILTAIADEAMCRINRELNFTSLLENINLRFLNPAFVAEPMFVRGWNIKQVGEKIENRVEIENELGKILVRATGNYKIV